MSTVARRALTSALTAALGISAVFQISTAADAQSVATAQNEAAAPVHRAKGPLEILLSQHQQRTRQDVSVQPAGSSQANAATPSSGLPAVATPPLDVQPTAPLGTANNVRKNGVATASASPGTAPVSLQTTPLGRELPAVSNQSKELAQPASNGKEGD
jgi:hypothetical protein